MYKPMPNKKFMGKNKEGNIVTNQYHTKENTNNEINELHLHSIGMKHNKLPKYSKSSTTEYPSEQSTLYSNTYNQNNKVAVRDWSHGCYN
jgi:hypothetical protein